MVSIDTPIANDKGIETTSARQRRHQGMEWKAVVAEIVEARDDASIIANSRQRIAQATQDLYAYCRSGEGINGTGTFSATSTVFVAMQAGVPIRSSSLAYNNCPLEIMNEGIKFTSPATGVSELRSWQNISEDEIVQEIIVNCIAQDVVNEREPSVAPLTYYSEDVLRRASSAGKLDLPPSFHMDIVEETVIGSEGAPSCAAEVIRKIEECSTKAQKPFVNLGDRVKADVTILDRASKLRNKATESGRSSSASRSL
jgi:hypothetical protein